jgi:hypothetical protein
MKKPRWGLAVRLNLNSHKRDHQVGGFPLVVDTENGMSKW